ncbi:MAG: hypothetical protein ACJAU0_000845 [Flavobacteriales bacterium]|jgi:hypothetical protein
MRAISKNAQAHLSELYHNKLGWSPAKEAGESVLLTYSGDINQRKIDALLKLTEEAILDHGSKRQVMKRVCTVLIECLQNISIHGAKDNTGKGKSFFILSTNNEDYIVRCGNLVFQEDANLLAFKIDELNAFSLPELRKLYIETLCNDSFNYKGGAGLGFLTIAKKSSKPMTYELISTESDLAFFSTIYAVAK